MTIRERASRGGSALRAGAPYGRDRFTRAAFGALLAFGFLNAVLGPALPYLRATEHTGYVVAALHQVAFALGGGLAGLAASRTEAWPRRRVIRLGLVGAAGASLGIGYAGIAPATVAAAFLVSLLGTSGMVRLWAALADAHPDHRATALTEGEVAVSLGGVLCPLLVSGLASTVLSWRFAFVLGAVLVVAGAALVRVTPLPRPGRASSHGGAPSGAPAGRGRRTATLLVVFSVVALEFCLSFWLASYLEDSVGLPRREAVLMVSGVYVANVVGRLAVSRLSRRCSARALLGGSLAVALAGTPVLLAAGGPVVAGVGLVITGVGIGGSFPLASSLHVGGSGRTADGALGQVFSTAAVGQVVGPLVVGVVAQLLDLRLGLLMLPALAMLGLVGLAAPGAGRRRTPGSGRAGS